MSSLNHFLLLFLELVIATIIIYQLVLRTLPYLMYALAKKATVKNANKLRYFDLPTPQNKTKMPSPEILYSIAFYDVRKKNVRISGDIPTDTYWSIALHTNNSINFLTKNDAQYPDKKINMLLVKSDKSAPFPAKADEGLVEIIRVPSPKGIVVLRILQPNYFNEESTSFKDMQQSIVVEEV